MSDEVLMESVGSQCALLIFEEARRRKAREIFILCGPGNNGGDGLVVARQLMAMGLRPRVFISEGSSSKLLKLQALRLEKIGLNLESFSDLESTSSESGERIYVDALFGVGISRILEASLVRVIDFINGQKGFKISIDSPTGLNLDTGGDWGRVMKADLTLTVGAPKPGFFTAQGPLHVGRIKVIFSSFLSTLFPDSSEKYFVCTQKEVLSHLPKRSLRAHKGSVGKVHLVVGSEEYLGAAKLCAMGALASGASFVLLYGPSSLKPLIKDLPEVILKTRVDSLFDSLKEEDCVVIGSGGTDQNLLSKTIRELKKRKHPKVLLDAMAFEAMILLQEKALEEWVWTPHPGEMSRLLSQETSEVESDRFGSLRKAQNRWGGQFLLKGYQPIFKNREGDFLCLPYGDHRLGKAGTGDVLGGLIGGLLAQNLGSQWSVALGVYLHAKSAEKVTEGRNSLSLLTSELPRAIGQLMKET